MATPVYIYYPKKNDGTPFEYGVDVLLAIPDYNGNLPDAFPGNPDYWEGEISWHKVSVVYDRFSLPYIVGKTLDSVVPYVHIATSYPENWTELGTCETWGFCQDKNYVDYLEYAGIGDASFWAINVEYATIGGHYNTPLACGFTQEGTWEPAAWEPGEYSIVLTSTQDLTEQTYIFTLPSGKVRLSRPPIIYDMECHVFSYARETCDITRIAPPATYFTLELTGLHTASAHLQEIGVTYSIQLPIRSYSDLSYNIDPAQLALIPLTETSSIDIGDVKLPGRLPLVVRRYNIDSIAGTYIDQFEITHNKYDTWDEHVLDMVMGGQSKQTLYPVNVKSAIYVQSWSGANVNDWGIVNRVVIKLPILAESAYTFPVFYRSRRVSMIWQMFSVFKFIQDVTRTRSISGNWIADSIFEWAYKYLFLKRRIYINIEPFAVLELLFTLWKEGNPAIRVEPIKWYKKRLDAGDIIIKENPWI